MTKNLLPEGFRLDEFLQNNEYKNLDGLKLIHKLNSDFGSYTPLLVEQLKIYSKAKEKLPEFCSALCLFTEKSFEQSSSEALALFKTHRFTGSELLVVGGGLGVDDWGFSKSFKNVTSIDINTELNKIARYNYNNLKAATIKRIDASANEYLIECGNYDMIYIDADRRTEGEIRRAITFHDSKPNILNIKDKLFQHTGKILLKLSPLIDISYITKNLPEIKEIYVVSLAGEVKEILALLTNEVQAKPEIIAIDLDKKLKETEFRSDSGNQTEVTYENYGKYFFEPASALIKSGLVPEYAFKNGLKLVSKNSPYLTGDTDIEGFFGRKFKTIAVISFSKSKVKKYLEENKLLDANIARRNFLLTVDEIRKILKLKDGGDNFLFFTTDSEKKKLMYHVKKF